MRFQKTWFSENFNGEIGLKGWIFGNFLNFKGPYFSEFSRWKTVRRLIISTILWTSLWLQNGDRFSNLQHNKNIKLKGRENRWSWKKRKGNMWFLLTLLSSATDDYLHNVFHRHITKSRVTCNHWLYWKRAPKFYTFRQSHYTANVCFSGSQYRRYSISLVYKIQLSLKLIAECRFHQTWQPVLLTTQILYKVFLNWIFENINRYSHETSAKFRHQRAEDW